jgi:hypothetical protein
VFDGLHGQGQRHAVSVAPDLQPGRRAPYPFGTLVKKSA